MKTYIFLYLLIFISFSGCIKNTTHDGYVNLEQSIRSTKSCQLSQISDSISYIFLETNENCLLPNNNSIIHIDSNDVFIRGGSYVYRFSRKGFFLNRIGNIGMGPKEYPSLQDVAVDFLNKKILLLTPGGALCFYDYDGEFIKKIQLGNEVKLVKTISADQHFVCETRSYNDGYSTGITEYNYNGEKINEVVIEKDELKLNRSLHTVSLMYQTDNTIKFKSLYNDTIYQYRNGNLSKYKVLNLGKYSPARDMIEDMNKKNQLLTQYVQIIDIIESDRYLFLLSIMNRKIYGSIVDKATHNIAFNREIENPKYGGGIANDFNSKGKVWPMLAINSNELAQIIHPSNIQMHDIDVDSNPVIQIIFLKKSTN